MSIIQEALKKTQARIENQRDHRKEGDEPKTASPKRRRFNAAPLFLVVFIIISIAIVKGLLPKAGPKLQNSAKEGAIKDPTSHQEVVYKPITPPEEPRVPVVLPAYAKGHEFILNGIMYLKDRPQAIINDSVVREGDTVSGAKVAKITKDNVVLNFNDLEITLSLKK